MGHGNKLAAVIVHKEQLKPVAVGKFRRPMDVRMDTDSILACMESSVRNPVAVVDTQLPHFLSLIASKIDRSPVF